MESDAIYVKNNIIKGNLKYDGVILLTFTIEFPEFSSSRYITCLRKVNRFYRDKANEYRQYCQKELFPMAVEQYKYDMKNGFPVRVFEVMQVYKVTYLKSCIISLYYDRYEYTGGAHGNTIRQSQTWNLQNCELLSLEQLINCQPDYKSYILSEVEEQIKSNLDIYFENYTELASKTFNNGSFYCTPEGIIIYYQQYDIAPYSSGIREFLIPYGGCVISPVQLCG